MKQKFKFVKISPKQLNKLVNVSRSIINIFQKNRKILIGTIIFITIFFLQLSISYNNKKIDKMFMKKLYKNKTDLTNSTFYMEKYKKKNQKKLHEDIKLENMPDIVTLPKKFHKSKNFNEKIVLFQEENSIFELKSKKILEPKRKIPILPEDTNILLNPSMKKGSNSKSLFPLEKE